jgi:hypothetical protein
LIRKVGWLAVSVALFWLVTAFPARQLWGELGLGYTGFAAVVCFVSAAATMAFAEHVRAKSPRTFPLVLLVNSGLRMLSVLAAGLIVNDGVGPSIEGFNRWAAWISLLVFYLYTLVFETVLLLGGRGGPRPS